MNAYTTARSMDTPKIFRQNEPLKRNQIVWDIATGESFMVIHHEGPVVKVRKTGSNGVSVRARNQLSTTVLHRNTPDGNTL